MIKSIHSGRMALLAMLLAALAVPGTVRSQGIYKLWGTTSGNGVNDQGTVFTTRNNGTNVRTQYKFASDESQGSNTRGGLVYCNGMFYGRTIFGGTDNKGAFYSYDPKTKNVTVIRNTDGLNGNGSSPYPFLTVFNNKVYGLTSRGGASGYGTLFEYDPVTNIFSNRVSLNSSTGSNAYVTMVVYDGLLYGVLPSGGLYSKGTLFSYDPATNTFTVKVNFGNTTANTITSPGYISGSLTVYNNRIYGTMNGGGVNGGGVLFEYDPATNTYTPKKHINANHNVEGVFATQSPMTPFNNKLYGVMSTGGPTNAGQLYEFDPATGNFAIKRNCDPNDGYGFSPSGTFLVEDSLLLGCATSGGAYNPGGTVYAYNPANGNIAVRQFFTYSQGSATGEKPANYKLVKLPAEVAPGQANTCQTLPVVTINPANQNTNLWVPITDSDNNAVAEIRANGNNLGNITASIYVNSGSVRQFNNRAIYLDRNITITPQFQPSSPVDVRLYIKRGEFDTLRSTAMQGQSYGINTVSDINVLKTPNGCGTSTITNTTKLSGVTNTSWNDSDYVLSMQVSSFSTFYFGKNDPVLQVSPRALLQGAVSGTTMTTALSGLSAFPKVQPYNRAPFNYNGAERVETLPANVTDWVLVDLLSASEPSVRLGTRAAFIKNDGSVVDLDGTSPVSFRDLPAGDYYLAIRHRNHLAIRSTTKLSLIKDVSGTYDFTTSQARAYQNGVVTANAAMKDLGNGKFALWAGNANGDDKIKFTGLSNDALVVIQALGGNQSLQLNGVYNAADLNMDGNIRYSGLNNDMIFLNSILGGQQSAILSQH